MPSAAPPMVPPVPTVGGVVAPSGPSGPPTPPFAGPSVSNQQQQQPAATPVSVRVRTVQFPYSPPVLPESDSEPEDSFMSPLGSLGQQTSSTISSIEHALRRSSRPHVPPKVLTYTDLGVQDEAVTDTTLLWVMHAQGASAVSLLTAALVASDTDDLIPKSHEQALRSPAADKWLSAMHDELASLQQHGTWELQSAPAGTRPLPAKWVFAIKRGADGSIERYKARLVVKGFAQIEGQDYS